MNALVVMAQIAERRCALFATDVESVIETSEITPIPRTPDFIVGLTAMRSQALTVIDCRTVIGEWVEDFPTDHRAIVVRHNGDLYALQVDSIEDVCSAIDEVDDIPGGFGEQWSRIAKGLIETPAGPALLLNLEALIDGPASLGVAA